MGDPSNVMNVLGVIPLMVFGVFVGLDYRGYLSEVGGRVGVPADRPGAPEGFLPPLLRSAGAM